MTSCVPKIIKIIGFQVTVENVRDVSF